MTNTNLIIILGVALLGTLASYMAFHSGSGSKAIISAKDLDFYGMKDLEEFRLRLEEFQDWTVKYNKSYSAVESPLRFKTWYNNYKFVQDHNSKNYTWDVELNHFSDLSTEEFAALHLGFNAESQQLEENYEDLSDLQAPASWDWRTKKAVGHVKDQGSCGGCYAFASAGALEGLAKLKTGTLWTFSNQQILECSSNYGNQGCNGGLMTNSYKYTKVTGIQKAGDYPWTGRVQNCRYNKNKVVYRHTGYYNVRANDPTALKNAVYKVTTAVAIQGESGGFQHYRSGIISSNCGTSLDHAVLAVGYGTSGNQDYWIIRNSWGKNWGEQGYVRIARGTQNSGRGVCGVNSMATYPSDTKVYNTQTEIFDDVIDSSMQ